MSRTSPRRRNGLCYDRGAENAALRALAPDRVAYRLDAATMRIERLP